MKMILPSANLRTAQPSLLVRLIVGGDKVLSTAVASSSCRACVDVNSASWLMDTMDTAQTRVVIG